MGEIDNVTKILNSLNESRISKKDIDVFSKGTELFNAPITTGDKINDLGQVRLEKPLEAWERKIGDVHMLIKSCPNEYCESENPKDFVGAHVVREKQKQKLRDNQDVYIIPLCRSCNSAGIDKKIRLSKSVEASVLPESVFISKRRRASVGPHYLKKTKYTNTFAHIAPKAI